MSVILFMWRRRESHYLDLFKFLHLGILLALRPDLFKLVHDVAHKFITKRAVGLRLKSLLGSKMFYKHRIIF